MFLMLYNFVFDGFGNPRKLKPRKPAIGRYEKDKDATSVLKMSKPERDNLIMDLSRAILTHPSMSWIGSKPGSYDNLKRASRVAQILENGKVFEKFKEQYGVSTAKEINEKFKTLPLLEDIVDDEGNVIVQCLENFVKEHKETMNPLELSTFKYFHRQNMTGGALVGIYANNTTMQAKYQETNLWLKSEDLIKINGNEYTDLTVMYSLNGELVSFNCSETSAASVDNGKDPVLADLMQNKKTAKVLGMLLRAGIPIDDATMVFNLPNVREEINKTGSLDNLKLRVENLKGILKNVFNVDLGRGYDESTKSNNLSSEDIIDFVVEYREKHSDIYNILNSKLTKEEKRKKLESLGYDLEEVKNFIKKDIETSTIVKHYNTVANDLREITNVSRADSPNGAIEHTIQDANIQKRKVDLLHMTYKKTTIQGIQNVISNDYISMNDSPEEMLAKLLKHGTPRLQAFYSFGIDLPLSIVGEYFVQSNDWMSAKVLEIFNQSASGVVSSKVLKYFYNGMMHYCLSNIRLFGTDENLTFEEKRDWYVYEFPKLFINLRNKHPELAEKHAVIRRLEVRNGKIEMQRAGRLTETQRAVLSNSITTLLQGNDIEKQLAVDLLIYAYHTTGLNFGPNNYGMFFNTTFYNQFPEFVNALRSLKYIVNDASGLMNNFMDQFYAIYGTSFTPLYDSENNKLGVTNDTKMITLPKKDVVNRNIKQQFNREESYKYITIEYPTTRINENGEEETIQTKALFKLIDGNDVENSRYERVGSIYDPFTGHIRYNANRTAIELSKDVASEELQKKAEAQRKVNYKLGAKYDVNYRIKDNKNADLNAYAEANTDGIPADIFDYFEKSNNASYNNSDSKEVENVVNNERFDAWLNEQEQSNEDSISYDISDFEDSLPNEYYQAVSSLEEDNQTNQSLDELEALGDIERIDDYNIEEGEQELEQPLCKPKK